MAVTLEEAGLGQIPIGRAPRTSDIRFGEVLSATTGYYLDPVYERFRNVSTYGLIPERDFDWESVVPERHSMFAADYSRAVNAQHAAEITRAIDESIGRRQTMANAGVGQVLLAEVLNPVNLLAIPIGGPVVRAGSVSALRTMGRAGAAAGATGAALNFGLVQPFDPVQTSTESLINTASYAVFGAAFGGVASIPASTRLAAQQQLREQANFLGTIALRANELGVADTSTPPLRRAERPLGNVDDVEAINGQYLEQISGLQRQLSTAITGSRQAQIIEERIADLQRQRQPYAQEAFARELETLGVDTNDIYRPSRGGDNWVLNFVTTPARRILTANYGGANNTAKRVIAEMAYDSGLQLELQRAGATSGLSTYQRAAADLGEFARASDELRGLWAEDTGAPAIGSSVLAGVDLNATNVRREASRVSSGLLGTARRQPATQTEWLFEVSRKRILGEQMTDAQARAADIITRFFETWEARLIETGQLRTRATLKADIDRLSQRVEDFRARLAQEDTAYRRAALRGAEEDLARARFELENPPAGAAEPHLPRYWRLGAIRERREEFANILKGWFRENPYITRFNEETKTWERIALGTDEDAIARRVDQTIDNILNENQNKDVEEVFVGGGRSTNIQARSLDIPNSLVVDFIELDPTALMATYARRTAPQYHFRKQFGGRREDVLARVTEEMRRNNVSEQAIRQYVRDFDTLYRRVVGRVVENPEALNQKTAAFLRDMAAFSFLGGAGIAAVGDLGRIVMENAMPTLGRSMQSFFDPTIRAINKNELRKSGAALDMLLGSAYLRVMDDQNFNVLANTRMDKLRNAFYTANLLGPVTTIGKEFAGMNGAHMLIEYSQRLARNEASPTEIAYLARYGINREMAENIANSPWQTDPNTGLILANTDAWESNVQFRDARGNRIEVLEALEGSIGREVGGEYQPAYVDKDGVLHIDRDYIESTFNEQPWTRPEPVASLSGIEKLKDAQRFDEKPWTGPEYGLPEDAITSREQWLNFLALRRNALSQSSNFLASQRSLFTMTPEQIIDRFGDRYNFDTFRVNDPRMDEIAMREGLGPDNLGVHLAFLDGNAGTIYINKNRIRSFWNRWKDDVARGQEFLDELDDAFARDDLQSIFGSKFVPTEARQTVRSSRIAIRDLYKNYPELRSKRPLSDALAGMGGIAWTRLVDGEEVLTPIAQELAARGIERRQLGKLFNPRGSQDLDNIVLSELADGGSPRFNDDGAGYVDRDDLIEALEAEIMRGEPQDTTAEGMFAREQLNDLQASRDEALELPQRRELLSSDVAYIHLRNLARHYDRFESPNDFAEFVLFHELEHGRVIQRRGESVESLENRVDEAAIQAFDERRAAQRAERDAANAFALQASLGNAMPENAFASANEYANFLGYRAIAETAPEYSFRSLGLNGRRKADRLLRNAILNRAAMRDFEIATRTSRETVNTFRGALNSHVNNVVMSATAMDRPTIMDGVVYLPERYGKLFGLEADPNVPGYVRVENGFLALPLQFFGFAMANVNKTVGVMMQGAVRNRLGGVVAMMSLGYMISAIRTPDYVWDEMSAQDRLGKAFDMSGVAALYSDLFYTTLQTSLALGGPNITGGVLQPRYPQDPNMVDAVTNVTGAASGWTADMIRSAATFASGDYGEGASQFVRNLPFSNLWFLREDVNQLGRYLAN